MMTPMSVGESGDGLRDGERSGNVAFEEFHGD
jgi:hypothetical protein